MLDWSNEPLLAVIVTLGGCVAVPLCHTMLWGVFRGRLALWKRLKEGIKEKNSSVKAEINIIEQGQHIGTDDNLVISKVSNHKDHSGSWGPTLRKFSTKVGSMMVRDDHRFLLPICMHPTCEDQKYPYICGMLLTIYTRNLASPENGVHSRD